MAPASRARMRSAGDPDARSTRHRACSRSPAGRANTAAAWSSDSGGAASSRATRCRRPPAGSAAIQPWSSHQYTALRSAETSRFTVRASTCRARRASGSGQPGRNAGIIEQGQRHDGRPRAAALAARRRLAAHQRPGPAGQRDPVDPARGRAQPGLLQEPVGRHRVLHRAGPAPAVTVSSSARTRRSFSFARRQVNAPRDHHNPVAARIYCGRNRRKNAAVNHLAAITRAFGWLR